MKKFSIKQLLCKHPGLQTAISAIMTLTASVLAGALIFEIEKLSPGQLLWKNFYKVPSFYLIVIFVVIYAFYEKVVYKMEKEILKYLDEDYCKAYLIKNSLPELTKKYKQDIRSDKNPDEWLDVTQVLERLKK